MHASSLENMGRFVARHLAPYRGRPTRILDLGSQDICGSYRPLFDDPAWEYVGLDLAPGRNVHLVLGDPYHWSALGEASADVVVSGQAFEHIEFFWLTMLEIVRVLRPGGLCCIIAPSGGYEHRYPVDCWRFFPDGFRALARYAGLETISAYVGPEAGAVYPDESALWADTVFIGRKPEKSPVVGPKAPAPVTPSPSRMHIFTSVTSNYIPKARVLAHSIKQFHPRADFTLVLSDTVPDWLGPDEPFDRVVTAEELGIPEFRRWVFQHSLVEMCTAVKGFACRYLMDTLGADKVFYFDPDIVVFAPLDALLAELDRHAVILTPHQTEPETTLRAIIDNEICSLKHGVFNLGFLGLRAAGDGRAFADWWTERLRLFCHDDIPGGIFTDQRWVDLAPCFFSDLHVLREPEYNVCTWNISTRKVEGDLQGGITVNGRPLCFYHFSGFDSGAQEIMLGVYGGDNMALRGLRDWYIAECDRRGQREYGRHPCLYGRFENGEPVTREHRLLYRERQDLRDFFPDPFATHDLGRSYYHWYLQNAPAPAQPSLETLETQLREARLELERVRASRTWRLADTLRRLYRSVIPCRP